MKNIFLITIFFVLSNSLYSYNNYDKNVNISISQNDLIIVSDVNNIMKYSKAKNLEFVETLCGINCLSILKLFKPDRLKVASRDLTNLPLIQALSETKIPIILSTGMSGLNEINNALDIITKYHNRALKLRNNVNFLKIDKI